MIKFLIHYDFVLYSNRYLQYRQKKPLFTKIKSKHSKNINIETI